MPDRPPQLRKHTRGYWFCRWGGRDHYFGKISDDPHGAEASQQYAESLTEWRAWRDSRVAARLPANTGVTVAELLKEFLRVKTIERGASAAEYYAKHLGRFSATFGHIRADLIRPRALAALKEEMMRSRFAPKTICHDLTAIRVMFGWAVAMELIPQVSFRGVRNPPLGPPPDKSMPLKDVKKMVSGAPEGLKAWLAITYLALLRPSETVKVVAQEGRWVEPGIFRLDRGKMDKVSTLPRHCVFSPTAMEWLEKCRPTWATLDSFSKAVRVAFGNGNGPGRLRHSAAAHLSRIGVDPASIELLLGHAPRRLEVTYYQPGWPRLRKIAARLRL